MAETHPPHRSHPPLRNRKHQTVPAPFRLVYPFVLGNRPLALKNASVSPDRRIFHRLIPTHVYNRECLFFQQPCIHVQRLCGAYGNASEIAVGRINEKIIFGWDNDTRHPKNGR